MKKAVDVDDICGKTVEKVDFGIPDELVILFTDGSFTLFRSREIRWDEGTEIYCLEVGEMEEWAKRSYSARAINVVSEEEYKVFQQEEFARLEQQQEEKDRIEYERLKAKFEGKKMKVFGKDIDPNDVALIIGTLQNSSDDSIAQLIEDSAIKSGLFIKCVNCGLVAVNDPLEHYCPSCHSKYIRWFDKEK